MHYELLLQKLQDFVPVQVADFELVAKHLKVVRLKKNEIWEAERKISHLMAFVNSGLLRQYCLKDGVEFTLDFYMESDFAGNYISYQNQQPSTSITEAIEACELLVMPFEAFEKFYATIPSTKEAAKIVGDQKLLQLSDRNSSLLMDTPEERYYKLMEEKPQLINRIPQYLIAQYLGIRPESLSRIRKRHLS